MSLESYKNDGSGAHKQTHVTFTNPDHPDATVDYADEDLVREHFLAAKAIKNSSLNRNEIVGDFLVALNKKINQGQEGAIEEFLEELID